jgi:HK97 gp10 family phage protein
VAKNKVDMSAFNKSMNSIDKAFIERLDKIEKAFVKSMQDMEREATAAAPVGKINGGRLKNSINYKEVGKLSYELRADVPYAAFVEFGTGLDNVVVGKYDEYWQKIADPFRGVDPNRGQTIARPFFYPTVTKNIVKLKNNIKNILSKNA